MLIVVKGVVTAIFFLTYNKANKNTTLFLDLFPVPNAGVEMAFWVRRRFKKKGSATTNKCASGNSRYNQIETVGADHSQKNGISCVVNLQLRSANRFIADSIRPRSQKIEEFMQKVEGAEYGIDFYIGHNFLEN